MRRITVLVASALISASTIAGLAAESTKKDVNAARAVSMTVHSRSDNAVDTEKGCHVYAASLYESIMLRQAAGGADDAPVLTALYAVTNIFDNLSAPKCGG